ncbi:hypothetical protein [Streptomyces mirabilis]
MMSVTFEIVHEPANGRLPRLLSAQVTWFLSEDTLTKTVQARLLLDASV